MGAFGWIMLFGSFGTATFYWLSRGRYESFVLGRFKTGMAFFFWYVFIIYLIAVRIRGANHQSESAGEKSRILD
jgi:hypothetical protein